MLIQLKRKESAGSKMNQQNRVSKHSNKQRQGGWMDKLKLLC
jgi:hypothetical protein